MIYDIIGFMAISIFAGVIVFAVGIHIFIIVGSMFAKSVPIKQNGNLRVIERDYDYDTDY